VSAFTAAAKARDLDRLTRFREANPDVPVLAKAATGPVAFLGGQPVRGRTLWDLLNKLDELFPPAGCS
jgi:hypothetical protein